MDKLKIVPVDLSKLSNIVNNEVIKKNVSDKLLARVNSNLSKINNIDTNGFVLKAKYVIDMSDLEKKSVRLTREYLVLLVKKIDHNAEITEIESKTLVFLV